MRPGEDRQGCLTTGLPPLWVRSCDVTDERAVRPGRPFKEKRQVRGEGESFDLRHEQSEAVLLDEVVELGQVGFAESGGYVHRRASLSQAVAQLVFFRGSTPCCRRRFAPHAKAELAQSRFR
jgi:hypothetical protein